MSQSSSSRPLLLQLTKDPCCPVVRHVLVLDASCNSDETSRHREQKWYVGFFVMVNNTSVPEMVRNKQTLKQQQYNNEILLQKVFLKFIIIFLRKVHCYAILIIHYKTSRNIPFFSCSGTSRIALTFIRWNIKQQCNVLVQTRKPCLPISC